MVHSSRFKIGPPSPGPSAKSFVAMSYEPWATSVKAWALSPEPWAMNQYWESIDYWISQFKVSKFIDVMCSHMFPLFKSVKFSSFRSFKVWKAWNRHVQTENGWFDLSQTKNWKENVCYFISAVILQSQHQKEWFLTVGDISQNPQKHENENILGF